MLAIRFPGINALELINLGDKRNQFFVINFFPKDLNFRINYKKTLSSQGKEFLVLSLKFGDINGYQYLEQISITYIDTVEDLSQKSSLHYSSNKCRHAVTLLLIMKLF